MIEASLSQDDQTASIRDPGMSDPIDMQVLTAAGEDHVLNAHHSQVTYCSFEASGDNFSLRVVAQKLNVSVRFSCLVFSDTYF